MIHINGEVSTTESTQTFFSDNVAGNALVFLHYVFVIYSGTPYKNTKIHFASHTKLIKYMLNKYV